MAGHASGLSREVRSSYYVSPAASIIMRVLRGQKIYIHMQIKSQFTNAEGGVSFVTYEDADSFESLLSKEVTQVYGICFYNDKLLVVYNKKKDFWTPVGGSIERGETFEECLKREVQEESNMEVLFCTPIGYQEVRFDGRTFNQIRYACLVEPYGDFISDPYGDVTEIKLVDSKDYKQYFDWGEVGDRIMERALELKEWMAEHCVVV